MYKIYFKQAIQMLKQNKFISIISILGTALAIMMIMTLVVTEEVKSVNIAPEVNRDRTLYISYQVKRDTIKGSWHSGDITYDIIKDYLYPLKTPEYVTVLNSSNGWAQNDLTTVNKEGDSDYVQLSISRTDDAFWKIFSFNFISGTPFSQEEFQSGIPNAVISATTAKKLFKDENALGKTIQIGFKDYKVCGIVQDISPVFKNAGGDIWIPYSSANGYQNSGYNIALLAKSKDDFGKIIAEVREAEKKFEADHSPWFIYLKGPENQKIKNMGIYGNDAKAFERSLKISKRKMFFTFLILLLIPALNLSGFSLSRIKKRMAEIGIRKAFGAKKYVILIQVLYENMITSLIGGITGLLLSYIVIFSLSNWLLSIPAGSGIPVSGLVSPAVFIAVFVVCILLNLLSAGLSAYRASRMSIVDSLNQNDK